MVELFPAIDILGGKIVRLTQGDYDRSKVYGDEPAAQARAFAQAGAAWVHVVDLDGARGNLHVNDAAIEAICATNCINVEVGGGVRSLERIQELADLGVKRIVLGTRLAKDPAFAREAARRFGGLLVAGVDAKDGIVAVDGWQTGAGMAAEELIGRLADMGYGHLVYTNIAKDGMQSGIDVDEYRAIARTAGFPVVVSGGVATLEDIAAVAAAGSDVFEGVITGRALYEGNFTVEQALAAIARASKEA